MTKTPACSVGLFVWQPRTDAAALTATLSAEERAAWAARRHARRAREYLASRWLLRQHLAQALDRASSDLAIAYPPGAPPRCSDAAVHLGLSHGHGVCLSVVSAVGPVGCDIECIQPRRYAPERVARAYFDPREADALAAMTASEAAAAFHRLWTLKEAALKACGHGLAHGLRQPAFALRPGLRCLVTHDAGRWWFAARDLTLGEAVFSVALAGRGPQPPEAPTIQRFATDAPPRPVAGGWTAAVTTAPRG